MKSARLGQGSRSIMRGRRPRKGALSFARAEGAVGGAIGGAGATIRSKVASSVLEVMLELPASGAELVYRGRAARVDMAELR